MVMSSPPSPKIIISYITEITIELPKFSSTAIGAAAKINFVLTQIFPPKIVDAALPRLRAAKGRLWRLTFGFPSALEWRGVDKKALTAR